MSPKRAPAPDPETAARQPPPHNLEVERGVLGSILLSGQAALHQAQSIVEVSDFFSEHHRRIWTALVAVAAGARGIDLLTAKDELERRGDLELAGGAAYISSLVDGVPKSTNIEYYARIVKEKAVRRALQARAFMMAGACANGHQLHELQEEAAELYRASMASDPEIRRRCAPTSVLAQEYAASVARGPGRRLHTGFDRIDRAIGGGIAEGEVLTVVKRPQVGGSLFGSQVIVGASHQGEASVFFTLEMMREQAFERAVGQRLGLTRIELEHLAGDGWRGLSELQHQQLEAFGRNVVFVDRAKSGIADLDASMLEATATLGRAPRLAVIDYLGLLSSGAKNLPLYQRVSEAAVDVKSFAKRQRVAVVLIAQAGRDPDLARSEGAARLGLDAARDSGQIEEAADFVVTLWRPELFSQMGPPERREVKGQLHGALVKNRRGPLVDFRLLLDERTLQLRPWNQGGES